ncbi:MAG: SRPBCC domain-containing protein [Xanthobacteraceae bacterium]|nr:SRPBCC domain-containing protein [Xanthobacteraceae bacterium]
MVSFARIGSGARRELVIERVFNAPREIVFRAWADREHLARWFGPRWHPARDLAMDVRPGGRWRACLRSAETGNDLWVGGVYREITPPERLVFTFAWEEEGERGLETVVSITLTERDGKTHMTMRQTPFQSDGERHGHLDGWSSCFDRLDDLLAA